MSVAAVIEQGTNRQRYPNCIDTAIPWFGEVPSHWRVVRLRRTIRSLRNGTWGNEPDGENDIICVRVADFDRVGFSVRLGEPTVRAVSSSDRNGRVLRRGDLLLEKSGGGELQPVGAVVRFDCEEPAVCSNFVARVVVAADCDSRFMTYVHAHLYDGRVNTRSIKQTTGIQNLDSYAYLSELVGIPPLEEQRAIAAFLDRETARIDSLIAKKQRFVELLQEKRTALISHVVTGGLVIGDGGRWQQMQLGRAIKLQRGFDITGAGDSDGSIPVISSGGFSGNCETAMVKGPGVIVGRKGTLGTVHYVETDYWPHDTTLWVKQFRGNCPRFVYYFLIHMKLERFDVGAANPTVNRNHVHPVVVSWPDQIAQRAIATFLDQQTDQLAGLSRRVEDAMDRLREYRSALISAAVTGKIDVRGQAEIVNKDTDR